MTKKITNINVEKIKDLPSPDALRHAYPRTDSITELIDKSRKEISDIIHGRDNRPLLIVGPCSIHDPKAAFEYANKLVALRDELQEKCCIIMRVYFEKPRTTLGWKGLINDPDMDETYHIEKGLQQAREVLLTILNSGLPTASEMLDPIVPQYIADLVCWASLGARTTESQPHREMASGLSMPVGFKNATNGDVSIAINAMKVSQHAHRFIGTNKFGTISHIETKGNPDGHLILRGGSSGPNFDPITIRNCASMLKKQGLCPKVLIDCSHANSKKKQANQPYVFENVMHQHSIDNSHILGVMIESNLNSGNQPIPERLSDLEYGVSVTDECIDWETTERIIRSQFN